MDAFVTPRWFPRVSTACIQRFERIVLASVLLILVSACAGRPKAVLLPVAETSPAASQVNMMVVTTRERSTNPGEMFTGERALAPSFVAMDISIPPENARKVGEVAWPKRLPSDPKTDFAVVNVDNLDRAGAIKWFDGAVRKTPDRSVLVFIHGFNNTFEDSVYRFAQIAYDSGTHAVPVLVTWPSRGSLLAYGYDRESTNYTRNGLETLFQYLAHDPNVGEVSILAHSMGNWLALEGLRQMAIRNGGLPAKFKNVMLADADVDVDVFRSQIADMGRNRPNFTLFVSRDDRALAASKRVWGDVDRLGAIDPEQSPYKEELAANEISVIDLTNVKSDDALRHSKFAQSPEVVQLIGARLASGQTLTDSHVGFGDTILSATTSAATMVGKGVGLAVAAPVALVDQDTRNNFGGQVESLAGTSGKPGKPIDPKAHCKDDSGNRPCT